MSSTLIKKTVLFEKIIPDNTVPRKIAIEASQKRLALQDALNTEDLVRIIKDVEAYRKSFKPVLDLLEKNRARALLLEQPQFEWQWEGDNKHMSSCWIWESIMTHAAGYYSNYNLGVKLAGDQDYKGASKCFELAGRYAITIYKNILPLWKWKETPGINVATPNFWQSKLYYMYAIKDICTLQFGLESEKGVKNKHALRLLRRAEGYNNKSMINWFDNNNETFMNWTRTARAFFKSEMNAENEHYGKAIGTARAWENILEQLIEESQLHTIMNSLATKLHEIVNSIDNWESSNSYVHHEVITSEELEEITTLEEIKNEITVL